MIGPWIRSELLLHWLLSPQVYCQVDCHLIRGQDAHL